MTKRPEKHLPYYTVLEALGKPGCFLCTLVVSQTRAYLGQLLDEYVNDPGFRKQWRASRGFCHRHSWMMAEAPEALGLSILYLDLVEAFGAEILDTPAGDTCAVCAAEERRVADHLEIIKAHWSEGELRAALSQSEGLCGPHLRAAMRIMRPGEPRDTIRRVSGENMALIGSQLKQLAESFDYRRRPPQDEGVRHAWVRAMRKLVGA